jgi:hypothetical protein
MVYSSFVEVPKSTLSVASSTLVLDALREQSKQSSAKIISPGGAVDDVVQPPQPNEDWLQLFGVPEQGRVVVDDDPFKNLENLTADFASVVVEEPIRLPELSQVSQSVFSLPSVQLENRNLNSTEGNRSAAIAEKYRNKKVEPETTSSSSRVVI